ncbi:uncharacterized protein [Littorina saxatilis]|uniref:uncharacterized protein n=1 Tax=Littorina saxatilis TaxID=31220 RepID=UPI0038B56169
MFCSMTHMHQQLANYFLASGRGRPPNPPGLTNKVLLLLQRQSGKPSSVVHSWFEKLFPEVTFPVDRIGGVIDRTEKQFKEHLSGETGTTAFLQVVRDLDSEMRFPNFDIRG